ncbi:MAG TPA: phytanoyl-CoA dioxygenase family protein [Jiangellaceae bacterium]|nr:phytanoyl-CoA dioxygenase family protein [Jiangellaceae bacterium]
MPTRDRSLTAAWIALDDATIENGCLWVIPGSHPNGVLYAARDGHLLHRSLPNTGRHGMRRALVDHHMSAESLLLWFPPDAGDVMGRLDHRDIEMIAGEDPYAHEGTVDLMRPHVRPAGDGGCTR